MARKKLIKTRIWEQPDFTESSGYILADGGENQPTGKLSFENLGKLLETNPYVIFFQKDGSTGKITPYRQTSFKPNVQPTFEEITYDWIQENGNKLMGCPAYKDWYDESDGLSPFFFFDGFFFDEDISQYYFDFQRLDTMHDTAVTEHSIRVRKDTNTGETICYEKKITIENTIEHVNAGQQELVPVNKTVTIPYANADHTTQSPTYTGGLMTASMVQQLEAASTTLQSSANVRSVLESYPDPNDSSVIRYRWVPIGTVTV